jgi:hypothetical protein
LTGKRFWKAAVFAGSRRSCGRLRRVSSLASRLYKTLPEECKGREVFQQLTRRVELLLIAGCEEAQLEALFQKVYFPKESEKAYCQQHHSKTKASLTFFHPRLFTIPYCTSSKKLMVRLHAD